MIHRTLVTLAFACLFLSNAQAQFSATTNANDAYIDVSWNLAQACFQDAGNNNQAYPDGVHLELFADGASVYIEVLDDPAPAAVSNTFRHYVGPGRSVNYGLMLYIIGPGDEVSVINCSSLTATGSTLGFQAPVNVTATDATRADAVVLSWQNKSLLSSSFQVIRKLGAQETLVATIPGSTAVDSVFTYVDAFRLDNALSLENGAQYEYCIRTYSELVDSTFREPDFAVCDMGSTYDINLQATDFTLTDRVNLTWNDVSAFADKIVIKRDREVVATLEDEALTIYSDTDPTYGLNSLYSIDLINAQGVITVQDTERGGADPIGAISGFVRSKEGAGVPGVKVKYEVEVLDSLIRDSTLTDFTGRYSFGDVFYARQGSFTLRAERAGASIKPAKLVFVLNNENPVKEEANFLFNTSLAMSRDSIALQQFEGAPGVDRLNFTWNYFSTADTTHFQLYREGTLVAIGDDATAPPAGLSDLTGKPNYYYAYELRAYAIRNDSIALVSVKDTVQFPAVEKPTNLAIQDNFDSNSMGVLTLSWDHSSDNFSGFRIYRDNVLLAVLGSAPRRFSDYTGLPGATYEYSITAFRNIDGEIFESERVNGAPSLFPAFFEPTNVVATPMANDNAVIVSWDIPGGFGGQDYFSGFKIMRNGQEIGEIMKGDTTAFKDLLGIPGVSYTYMVKTFVDQPDTVYASTGVMAAPVNFPAIATPVLSSVTPSTGKALASIDNTYNTTHNNFDGFIITANGAAFDTLQRPQTSAAYFPNMRGAAPVNVTIGLQAYRNINGQIFTSAAATQAVAIPLANNSLEAPGNINASEEFPMHVAVTWTYPTFKLSRFVVYRGNAVLDTLPTTARAYYDYGTDPGQTHEYSVKAIFNGAESIVVSDIGRRRNLGVLQGQLVSGSNGRNVDSLELRLLNGAQTVGRTFSNRAGYYLFENLPIDGGQSSLALNLQTMGRSVEVTAPQQTVPEAPIRNRTITDNFADEFVPGDYPPLPQRDTLVELLEVVAQPFRFQQRVAISWTTTEGLFDGFEVYRGLARLGSVRKGAPMFFIDSTGVGGFDYIYVVKPYFERNGVRIISEGKGAGTTYPAFPPVENLTATAGYFGQNNTINLNWSHRTGKVSYYQVERNEQILGLAPAGGNLRFEDNQGKPDQSYVYTVKAVLQQGTQLFVSDPRSVTVRYPKVGDPQISLTAVQDSNAVKIDWTYKGAYVDGYRIYRDGQLIATLAAADSSYYDLEGQPETNHEYSVVALLDRSDMGFQSEGDRDTITFPKLRPVLNLTATSVDSLGNANLAFDYYARGVDYFEMMYTINYLDANNMPQDSTLMFTLFYNELKNNKLTFVDELAIPTASIDYMVRAVSVRQGVTYYSDNATASLASYPRPPMPMNFTASDGTYDNRVELRWYIPLEANVDSFEIQRNNVKIAMVEGGRRTYSDVFNDIGNMPFGQFTYKVIAYRRDYNFNFQSVAATDTGWPGIYRQGYNVLASPTFPSPTFGWSVSMYGDKAAVGAPESYGGVGSVSYLRKESGNWNLKGVTWFGNTQEFGFATDLYENETAVGEPGFDSESGFLGVFKNGFVNPYDYNAYGGTPGSRLGQDVAIFGAHAYGSQQKLKNIYHLVKSGGNWVFSNVITQPGAPADLKEYISLDASDTYVVAGAASGIAANENGFVDVYQRSGNSFTRTQRLEGEGLAENFGIALSIDNNLMAIGADGKESGSVYIYQLSNSTWNKAERIDEPLLNNNTNTDQFGCSVSLGGNWLVVGARKHHDEGVTNRRTGLAFLYRKFGGAFEYVDYMAIPDGQGAADDDFGFSVAASSEGILIGAPFHKNTGAVFYFSPDLLELWNQKLKSVTASDGEFSSRTRVEWAFTGNRDYINGFNIYRDDELLATADPNQSVYQDTEGIPGKEYTYKVTVVTTQNRESLPKSDKGFRKGAGVLEGDVVTAIGNAPVPGVQIEAEAVVGGEKFNYSTVTDVNGHFYIDGVYFADETVTYSVMAVFEGHDFVTNPIPASISPENSVKSNIIFIDKTAYIARGAVRYKDVTCGLDSIQLRLVNVFNNNSTTEETVMTNADGEFSFVLRPDQAGLMEIRIEIDSISYSVDVMGTPRDTVLHHFATSDQVSFTNFINFPREVIIDFEDTLTYDVEFFVTTVCGGPASGNGSFDIEVSTRDGCFQTFVTTDNTGRVTAPLPPLDDLIITVKEGIPTTVENLLIVDYLRYRPDRIGLKTLHIDNFREQYSQVVLDSLTYKPLVYHKPAEIAIANEFGESFCNDASQPRLLRQGQSYGISFSVEEFHQGDNCAVNEGYLVVNNAAAGDNTRDTLFFVPERGRFESHLFEGGSPNLVFPFRKGINVKYFSAIGDFLAEVTIPVVVLGSAPLPGSDIIVDVTDDKGQVKIPIYVLRDPPGDGSSSSIEEGTTISKSLTESFEGKGGAGLVLDLKLGLFGQGLFTTLDILGGGGTKTEDKYELSFQTKQKISTSTTADFVGPDADVIVGIGTSTQYGLIEEVRFNEDSCKLFKVQTIDVTLNEIKTDWYYTVGQIKQLIKESKSKVDSVRAGSLEIQVGGQPLTPEQAIRRFETEGQNWQYILDFHQRESVPYYQLCAEKLDANTLWGEVLFYDKDEEYKRGIGVFGEEAEFTPETPDSDFITRVAKAKEARNRFCANQQVGFYNAQDSFILNQPLQEIIFTTDLAEDYEYASRAVDYYLDSLYLSISEVESRLSNITLLSGIFPEIENSTFSAGVEITKSAAVARSTSHAFTQIGFLDFAFTLGALIGTETEAGFGIIIESVDIEQKIGGQVKFNLEWNTEHYSSKTIESEISYTLSDDDPGDQFSVTAVKGRDPGHSPYFQLLGGRSSCPPENGAILRDQFDISLWDPETQTTFDFMELRNQDINSTAKFYVQLTSLNPFNEQRDLFVYHEGESNTNGATLILAGQYLGGGNYDGLTYTFINPNQPFILPLEVLPSPGVYQYDSIQIVLRPSCTDGDLYLLGVRDTVYITALFDYPCSDISIAAPGDDWLIRRRDPFSPSSRESLAIEIRDYDSSNPELEEIYLEYRRIGDGSGWTRIPTNELDPNYVVNIDSLASYDAANFGPGQIPKLFFVWDITERYLQYPDGIYEVRAIAFCGGSGEVQSNIIRGQIRRQTGDLFALTQPADGVWQVGDEISIRINKELDCNRVGQMEFFVVSETNGDTIPRQQLGCFYDDNKLLFLPTDPSLLNYDRHKLTATAYNFYDETGNLYIDTFKWSFQVVARDLYLEDNLLKTTMYQGTETTLSTTAFRNSAAPIPFTIDNLQLYPWITADPLTGFINSPVGRKLNFTIDADNLPIGDTTAVLVVRSTSGLINQGADTLRIQVKVLAKPPYWVVDPGQYSQNMTVIANYEFTDDPGNTSRDTMDLISAWIEGEIRGVARISSSGGGLYAAFMAVYGDAPDAGRPIEFRVWDASEGREYNAHATSVDSVRFSSNTIVGSFLNPEILEVDKAKDRARYIPLNGNGRWTWFSINSQEPDMSVSAMLRELIHAENGDVIKTASSSSSFVDGLGWVSVNGLNSLNPVNGYQIFLNGPDDTLRITGMNATYGSIPLAQGWNLVGYPLQTAQPINTALNVIGATGGDFIKTVAQDPTLPGLSANMVASYTLVSVNPNAFQWLFGNGSGMEVMRPFFAYQIRVAQPSVLLYPGATTPITGTVTDGLGYTPVVCDPNDPATWAVDPGLYPSNMIVTGILKVNGQQSFDPNDKVAAFVNGECRGVSPLYEVSALGQYMANLFIYGNAGDGEVEIRIYDASEGMIYLNVEDINFASNGLVGNFGQPYTFENKVFSASFLVEHTACSADNNGSATVSLVTSLEPPYTYAWSNGAMEETATGLAAGDYEVTITGQGGLWFVDTVRVENQMLEIPAPELTASFDGPVCRGNDAVFYAAGSLDGAVYRWSDGQGNYVHVGPALLFENMQDGFHGYLQADYHGCFSAPIPVAAEVYQPDAGFYAAPSEEITTQTELAFEPAHSGQGFSYQWDFGDGTGSTEEKPKHQYNLPGLYTVSLSLTDAGGCNASESLGILVESVTSTLELPQGAMTLEANPNPFHQRLNARAEVPAAGHYTLRLMSMDGKLVWEQDYDWPAGSSQVEVELSVPDAMYLLQLDDGGGGQINIPVVKQTPRP